MVAYFGTNRRYANESAEKEGPYARSLDQPVIEKAWLTPLGRQRHANLNPIVGPKILLQQNLLVTKGLEI
jgi:hypothetical protein